MVKGIETAPSAYIMIYDRHSKLLYKSIGSEFEGWDGNYNGHGMVQDDYWYVIQIPETDEILSGHFILKR
jgi:gliding motility-associated-like protein